MESSELRFKNLIGHDKARMLLQEAANKNRMAHAYLFRGPDGVGKKRAALTLGAFLNCKNPKEKDACGRCSSCRKYNSSNHPDLIIVAPDGAAIKISQVRELKKQLSFPPLEAKTRLIILEDINTMRREAANSLLKTLEEPAPNNLFILTAEQAGDVLPTIISRCQVVPFGPLDYHHMAKILVHGNEIEETQALALASVAEGSLGRARFLWKEDLLDFRREVVEQLLLGNHDKAETIALVFRLSEKASGLKENVGEFLSLLRLWYRDLVLAAAGSPESSMANQDLVFLIPEAQNRWNIDQLNGSLHRIDHAERQLSRNCNRTLVIEALFFDLI